MPVDAEELARRYAPLLVFGRDGEGRPENFYPMDAAAYIRSCALYRPGPYRLVPRGRLTPEMLLQFPSEATRDLYFSFASEALMPPLMRAATVTPPTAPHPRWADVWDDVLDQMYDFSARFIMPIVDLIVPQRLPKHIWSKALQRYAPFDPRRAQAPQPVLYYLLQPNERYLLLHFWFFYAFNDWGAGHGGHNDHEGDWESIHLFLDKRPPHPVKWLAYAAHGFADLEEASSGDVEWWNTHPVVYVGAGSHASYFRPGVYRWKDWAQGNGGFAVGPEGAQLYAWPRVPQAHRPRHVRTWRLVDLRTELWAWHFRGFWGTRFRYQWLGRAFHILHGISGPGGPVWLAGQNRVRPQMQNPLRWAGFRRRWWEIWKPRLAD